MLVNRNDERAWESYYTLQANKSKQGDATYEENEEFSNLTLEDQLIVRNQMHAAHKNWTWFHFITQISNEVLQTTATRRIGLSDDTLNMLLSLAQHAASMITKSKKDEDSREVQGAFLESLRSPPAASSPPMTSPKTLRKRLEEESSNNNLTTRSKFSPGSATRCQSMIDHASLLSWLTSSTS